MKDYKKALTDFMQYINSKDKHYPAGLTKALKIILITNGIKESEVFPDGTDRMEKDN